MMRRFLLVALMALVGVSAVGCGGSTQGGNSSSGLYIIDATGEGEPIRILDFPASTPRWSPDGDSLYFMGDARARRSQDPFSEDPPDYWQDPPDVYTSSVTGDGLTKLLSTDTDPAVRVGRHMFSPNLTMVAYQTKSGDRALSIRVVKLADSTSERELLDDGRLLGWSWDGKFLSYEAPTFGESGLFVTDLAGHQQLVEPASASPEGWWHDWVAWLPNRSALAYGMVHETTLQPPPSVAYTFELDTSERVEATELSPMDWWPTFSPDGRLVLYGKREGVNYGTYLKNLDEGIEKRVADGLRDSVWSPQSDKIAFVERGEITVYDVNDGASRVIELALGKVPEGMSIWVVDVAWSPAGDRLVAAVHPVKAPRM